MEKKRGDLPFILFVCACAAAILACGGYLYYHYVHLPRVISQQNGGYAELYTDRATEKPTVPASPEATASPTAAASPIVTASPAATASPTPSSSPAPSAEVPDMALGTPDPETIVYAAPTLPPVQESFEGLLAANPETVGFLTVGEMLTLPVVQRENDNEFYLTHDFNGKKSDAGCLFLDGVNRLEWGDKCLIVYGHNMKNRTMFGKLTDFTFKSVLAKNAIVYFDTIYEDRAYVPFACFALDADPGDPEYFDFRKFQFSEAQFDAFVGGLREHSLYDIPVDVAFGDDILLLVTCNYSVEDGRFLLALRRLRPGETEDGMRALVGEAAKR